MARRMAGQRVPGPIRLFLSVGAVMNRINLVMNSVVVALLVGVAGYLTYNSSGFGIIPSFGEPDDTWFRAGAGKYAAGGREVRRDVVPALSDDGAGARSVGKQRPSGGGAN